MFYENIHIFKSTYINAPTPPPFRSGANSNLLFSSISTPPSKLSSHQMYSLILTFLWNLKCILYQYALTFSLSLSLSLSFWWGCVFLFTHIFPSLCLLSPSPTHLCDPPLSLSYCVCVSLSLSPFLCPFVRSFLYTFFFSNHIDVMFSLSLSLSLSLTFYDPYSLYLCLSVVLSLSLSYLPCLHSAFSYAFLFLEQHVFSITVSFF